MTGAGHDLLSAVLRSPGAVDRWPPARWALLLQQARSAGLLARVAAGMRQHNARALRDAPAGFQAHVEAADQLALAQRAEITRELRFLDQALAGLDAPRVLLKGAAYAAAGLPAAEGRVFSDIDLMLPKSRLQQAEAMLMAQGWMNSHHTAYDQRYYREWMHELPPLQQVQRGTTLDVHHTILPETARLRPSAALLFEAAQPLAGRPGWYVLSPHDMLLHSMTHLFMNDDMSHALRDLSDLGILLNHFAAQPGFWDGLVPRARALQLGRPLFYGLRYTQRWWGVQIPDAVRQASQTLAPPRPLLDLMDAIWLRALGASHTKAAGAAHSAALQALYLRGHWLRMPPLLLARHLTVKALGLHERENPAATQPVP